MQDVQKEKQLKWEILTIRMALKKGYSHYDSGFDRLGAALVGQTPTSGKCLEGRTPGGSRTIRTQGGIHDGGPAD
jgi:hypothetical protein